MGCLKFLGRLCSVRRKPRETRVAHSETRIGQILKINPRKVTKRPTLDGIVQTSIQKETILKSPYTPRKSERKKYRFRCCICYSFFSNILECSECHNYICLHDLEEYLLPALKQNRDPVCPFCSWSPVNFKDVDPNVEKVKHYFSSDGESSQPEAGSSSSSQDLIAKKQTKPSSIRNFSTAVKRDRFYSEESEEEKVPLNAANQVFDYGSGLPIKRLHTDIKERKKKVIKPGKIQRLRTSNLEKCDLFGKMGSSESLQKFIQMHKENNKSIQMRRSLNIRDITKESRRSGSRRSNKSNSNIRFTIDKKPMNLRESRTNKKIISLTDSSLSHEEGKRKESARVPLSKTKFFKNSKNLKNSLNIENFKNFENLQNRKLFVSRSSAKSSSEGSMVNPNPAGSPLEMIGGELIYKTPIRKKYIPPQDYAPVLPRVKYTNTQRNLRFSNNAKVKKILVANSHRNSYTMEKRRQKKQKSEGRESRRSSSQGIIRIQGEEDY